MNFLPYVAGFLLLLALSSQSLLHIFASDKKIEYSYQGYMNASRKTLSLKEEKLYSLIPKEKLTQKKKKNTNSIKKQKQLINITPLLMEGKESRPILYSFLSHLFLHLYGDSLFSFDNNQQKAVNHLVDEIIASARKQKEYLHLEKLELNNTASQQLLYTMLKGSRPIGDLKKTSLSKEGIPSLYEFIYCSTDLREDRIPLVFVDKSILSSLFNKQVAERIVEYQEKTKKLISPFSLEKIFQESHFSYNKDLWKSLDFSPTKSRLLIEITSAEDEKTHIFLNHKKYLSSRTPSE